MTTREIRTDDGTTWTLAEAMADDDTPDGQVTVVATPDGGEQTLRLALDPDWPTAEDRPLVESIRAAREADGRD